MKFSNVSHTVSLYAKGIRPLTFFFLEFLPDELVRQGNVAPVFPAIVAAHVCVCVCVCTCTYMYACMHVCISVCMCVCAYMYACMCASARAHARSAHFQNSALLKCVCVCVC